jgi:hypothetical protein
MRRRVIENFTGAPVRILSEQEMLLLKKKLQAAVRMRYGADADLIESSTIPFEKHSALCSVIIGSFEEILSWPRPDAAAYFRRLRAHP